RGSRAAHSGGTTLGATDREVRSTAVPCPAGRRTALHPGRPRARGRVYRRHRPANRRPSTMTTVLEPPAEPDWVALTDDALPVDRALAWATTGSCGAVVCFLGVVRDNSEGRDGVRAMTYEAYEEHALRRLGEVAGETRRRWPVVERLALLHRIGEIALSDAS